MTKHSTHTRWKGHCALCGHSLGNSTRKWYGMPRVARLLGRTRRMSKKRIVEVARDEA